MFREEHVFRKFVVYEFWNQLNDAGNIDRHVNHLIILTNPLGKVVPAHVRPGPPAGFPD